MRRGVCLTAAFAVMGLAVFACSGSSATYAPYAYSHAAASQAPMQAPSYAAAPGGNQAGPTAAATAGNKAPAASGAPLPAPSGGNLARPEDQIIKIGQIRIEVENVDLSMARATDDIHGFGGFLAGSERATNTAVAIASVTFRVPANRFEDALATMRMLGKKVLSEHTETTPVGGQIVDLQARIENLKASEKAIQSIMSKANTIGDTLTVEKRLSEIRGEIEQLQAQLQSLTDQAAYSTLTVTFEVPPPPSPSPSPTPSPTPSPSPSPTATPVVWSAGDEFNHASGALTTVAQGGATIAIWLGVLVLPIVIAALLLAAIGALLLRWTAPARRRLWPETTSPARWRDVPLTPAANATGGAGKPSTDQPT